MHPVCKVVPRCRGDRDAEARCHPTDRFIFDEAIGAWTSSTETRPSIAGVGRDLRPLPARRSLLAAAARQTLGDAATDGLLKQFGGFTLSGDSILDYVSSHLHFAGVFSAGLLTSQTILPGALPGSGFGYGGAVGTGTGSFAVLRSTCFIDCTLKQAQGIFVVTIARIGAIPEPANWALLFMGFALVGVMTRRRRRIADVAA